MPEEIEIPKTEWLVLQQADSGQMIRVEWDQKYGSIKVAYCKVLFQSSTQYKLGAPWTNDVIEKSNVNNIHYTKESLDPAKLLGIEKNQ
jgi:hypothetical protein